MSPRRKIRRRIKRRFLALCAIVVLVLGVVRQCNPNVMKSPTAAPSTDRSADCERRPTSQRKPQAPVVAGSEPKAPSPRDWTYAHPVYSVSDYDICFPDSQAVQLASAQRYGVAPVKTREETDRLKHRLAYIGSCPYFVLDSKMEQSVPYLVPRAARLLQLIGRNFLDSLAIKRLPLHRVIVSSVWRTQDDVQNLSQGNINATQNSCHQYATTFDILYNRYAVVTGPRATYVEGNDMRLKFVLSEVLRDLREAGLCYIKHEKGQPCFHITVR